jgi:ABC-type lipoprotein export system ATPase subunit
MTPAVEIRDLFRVYPAPEGGVVALQGLTLDVQEGEICVVLGPSGSGKTTVLRMLAALDRPTAGSVRVLGRDLARLSRRARAGYRAELLGYADQHYWRALAAELEVRELVSLQLGLAGAPRQERIVRATELLERVGLRERARAHPRELSGGEQQRVAICAALAHRPRLLLADEPTGELDAANARTVYEAIGSLSRDSGTTTVIVSHDPESASIADRIVRVRDGRVSEEAALPDGRDEAIVVGRGGWLRLSEELLRRTGIHARATARLHEKGILLAAAPGGAAPVAEPEEDAPAAAAALAAAEVTAETRGVTRTYGEGRSAATALSALDAGFSSGRLSVVTGPSGSGKTTLLHLLAGIDVPTEGEVHVLGTAISALDRDGRARFRGKHIALVSQSTGLVPFLTAAENVELGLSLRGIGGAEARERAAESLAAVGLAGASGRRASDLSSGQQERAAVARAVAARPALLLADEPTARLDQANALAVSRLLLDLARTTGAAVVCATHDPLLIEHADDRLDLEHRRLASEPASAVESEP